MTRDGNGITEVQLLGPIAAFQNKQAVEPGPGEALLPIVNGRSLHKFEFIHTPPDIGFGDIDVALGIDIQRVAMSEFAELMSGA